MNLLFLDQFADTGGAQRCLLDLLPGVVDSGWMATVAAPAGGPLERDVRAMGVGFAALACGPFRSGQKPVADMLRFAWQTPLLARRIAKLARKIAADLIYINGPRLVPAAALAAVRVPLLFHCHSRVEDGRATAMVRYVLGRVPFTIVGSSRYVLEPLARFPSEVVYNGVADASAASASGPRFAAGVLGRIAPEKGQLQFVEAVRLLAAEHRAARFLICGAPLFGDREALHYAQRVHEAAAGLPIEFHDWSEDIGGVLASMDTLVAPSTGAESTTRVIPEAFSASLPVIASATGGIPEVVRDGVTGWLVPPGDAAALARAMAAVMASSPAAIAAMGAAARQEWQERFTLDRYRRDLLAIMKRAAASDRK